jgi:hypothetical protein
MKAKEIADYFREQLCFYAELLRRDIDFGTLTDIEIIEGQLTCDECGWTPFSKKELLAVIKSATNLQDFWIKCGCYDDTKINGFVCGGIHITHDPRTELTMLLEDIAKTIKSIEANEPTQYQMQILIKSFREDIDADVPANSASLQKHIRKMFQKNHGWGEPVLRTGIVMEMKRILTRLTDIAERLPAE